MKKRDPFRRAILAPRLTDKCGRCRKVNYSTKEKADAAAKASGKGVFLCPAGNGWHVGVKKAA